MKNVFIDLDIPKVLKLRFLKSFPKTYSVYFQEDDFYKSAIDVIILSPLKNYKQSDFVDYENLYLIQIMGVGIDKIPTNYLNKRNIKILKLKDHHEKLIAEYVLTNILLWERNIPSFDKIIREKRLPRKEIRKILLKDNASSLIRTKTLLIIGLGKTGKSVAKIAKLHGMKTIGVTRKLNKSFKCYVNKLVDFKCFKKFLEKVDYVSIHTDLNESTKEMIDINFLRDMKKSAVLINTSRGHIINEEDLIFALNKKIIRGATLDVFVDEPILADHPFIKLNNVILTPHIAGSSQSSLLDSIDQMTSNIMSHFPEI